MGVFLGEVLLLGFVAYLYECEDYRVIMPTFRAKLTLPYSYSYSDTENAVELE